MEMVYALQRHIRDLSERIDRLEHKIGTMPGGLRKCGCGLVPYINSGEVTYVSCSCGMKTQPFTDEDDAIACWNRGSR